MATGVRTKYHIAINGNGFMLRGAPGAPVYSKDDAPTIVSNLRFASRFAIDDFTQSQLNGNGWSYWTQTDWTGGFQTIKWNDNGSYRDGQAIDGLIKYGNVSLQNAFISAAKISGGHTLKSYNVANGKLLLGTIKSGGAKIFAVTSANAISQISASIGISAVNSMSKWNKWTLMGLTRTSGSLKTLVGYNGTTLSGFRSSASIVRAVKGIGIRAYFSEYNAKLSGDVLLWTNTLSAANTSAGVTSAYSAGQGLKIPNIENLNGIPYFLTDESGKVNLYRWDELAQQAFPIYTFDNLTNYGTKKYLSYMVITGTSNGKSVAYAFNGSQILQIFNDQLRDPSYDFSRPFEFLGNLQLKGAQWDSQSWYPGLYGKFANVQYSPFANFANRPYGFAISGTVMRIGYQTTGAYNISGFVVSSQYGGDIGGIDKLENSVFLDFNTLSAGQTIEVFNTADEGKSFTSVGKASYAVDGPVASKRIYFPSGMVQKLWNYKVALVGNGTNTPTLQDITHEFRPTPDLKKRWQLSVDGGDEISLLNKQREQRDGKALTSQLWMEREMKRTVTFEDVDGFSVTLVSGMSTSATSARVNSVRLMPPAGRMRVFKNGIPEEMYYTSADGGYIKGITRGRKSTLPRAYVAGDTIDNFYQITVVDVHENINDTDQLKTESIASLVLLEV
jgi:hypothetical protein